jgi:hypothetical protein
MIELNQINTNVFNYFILFYFIQILNYNLTHIAVHPTSTTI